MPPSRCILLFIAASFACSGGTVKSVIIDTRPEVSVYRFKATDVAISQDDYRWLSATFSRDPTLAGCFPFDNSRSMATSFGERRVYSVGGDAEPIALPGVEVKHVERSELERSAARRCTALPYIWVEVSPMAYVIGGRYYSRVSCLSAITEDGVPAKMYPRSFQHLFVRRDGDILRIVKPAPEPIEDPPFAQMVASRRKRCQNATIE